MAKNVATESTGAQYSDVVYANPNAEDLSLAAEVLTVATVFSFSKAGPVVV